MRVPSTVTTAPSIGDTLTYATPKELVKAADRALSSCKRSGRNRAPHATLLGDSD